jgi:hypothetical protein
MTRELLAEARLPLLSEMTFHSYGIREYLDLLQQLPDRL